MTYEYLKKYLWKLPEHYVGYDPQGEYLVAAKNRDADLLMESNFECIQKQLLKLAPDHVYVWRASCDMFGWFDYLMLKPDAPTEALQCADEIMEGLEAYPVVDDDHFSNLEHETAAEVWKDWDLSHRLWAIEHSNVSKFSIRHDYPPMDDCGAVQERLLGYC